MGAIQLFWWVAKTLCVIPVTGITKWSIKRKSLINSIFWDEYCGDIKGVYLGNITKFVTRREVKIDPIYALYVWSRGEHGEDKLFC